MMTAANASTNAGEMRRFLEALHGPAVEAGMYFSVWEKQRKSVRFFSDIDTATAHVEQLVREARDVYTSVGALLGLPASGRGTAADIDAIPGVWTDLDVGDHGNGKVYPPTRDDALKLVEAIGLRPTILIWTGRGLHAYWLFRELWVLDTPAEREAAAILVRRFVATVQAHARRRGWVLDSVGDLARVLRVPGSFNSANGAAVTIELLDESARCNPSDLEPLLVADEGPSEGAGSAERKRNPDDILRALQCLARLDPKLAHDYETWLRVGMALHWVDPGPTMPAAWDAWSRKSGKYEEGDCAKKWTTFGHRTQGPVVTLGTLIHLAGGGLGEQARSAFGGGDHEPRHRDRQRDEAFALLERAFDRPVLRWIKLDGEEPQYTLVLGDPGVEIRIGGADAVRSPGKFANALFRHGIYLESHVCKLWGLVLKALLAIETLVPNPDGLRTSRVRGLLGAYLQKATVHRGDVWHECITNNDPCLYDGALCIHAPTAREWLVERKGERIERHEFYDDLRAADFTQRSVSHASWKTSRSYWGLPVERAREHFPEILSDSHDARGGEQPPEKE